MRAAWGLAAALLMAAVGWAGDVIAPDDLAAWHDDFSIPEAWQAKPDWLSNPDQAATVARDGDAACFRVEQPGQGMKWRRFIPPVPLAEAPYLFLRYRAVNLNTGGEDYLVFADDHVADNQCRPVRLCDAIADGQWRTVAVDIRRVTSGQTVRHPEDPAGSEDTRVERAVPTPGG
jgi:hypothetical protein